MRPHRAAALLAIAGVAAAFGCSLIADYDGFDTGRTAVADAGCGKMIPGKPVDASAGGGPELVAITSKMQLVTPDGGLPLGYNLDGICNVCASAITRGSCNVNGDFTVACDDPGGIDNTLSRAVSGIFSDTSQLDRDIAAGKEGVLVQVKDYNGKSDDTQVTVAIYNVASLNDGGAAKLDGTDTTAVTDDSLLSDHPPANTIPPRYVDLNAYVNNGVLVANLDSFPLRFLIPDFLGGADATAPLVANISFTEAKLVGHIVVTGNGFSMADGQIVGRVKLSDIGTQLGIIGYCGEIEAGVKGQVCKNLDLAEGSKADGTTGACRAVSAAVGIALVGAKLVAYEHAQKSVSKCASTILNCP